MTVQYNHIYMEGVKYKIFYEYDKIILTYTTLTFSAELIWHLHLPEIKTKQVMNEIF